MQAVFRVCGNFVPLQDKMKTKSGKILIKRSAMIIRQE
jgi:hypothetical protein